MIRGRGGWFGHMVGLGCICRQIDTDHQLVAIAGEPMLCYTLVAVSLFSRQALFSVECSTVPATGIYFGVSGVKSRRVWGERL